MPTPLAFQVLGGKTLGLGVQRAAGWSPQNVPDLKLWLVADDIGQADGSVVAAWADRVGPYSFAQSTATKKPYLRRAFNYLNGHAAVRFDGSNDLLVCAQNISTASAGTIFAAYHLIPPAKNSHDILSSGDEGGDNVYVEIIGYRAAATPNITVLQKNLDVADQVRGGTAITTGPTYIAMWKSSGSAYAIRVNGAAESLTVIGGANNGDWFGDTANRDNFVVGGLKIGPGEMSITRGDIAEILMYDRELTAAEITQVENYLTNKYQNTTTKGYFTLGAPGQIMAQDVAWETSAPHTLSVVEKNSGGFTYWGYYGLQAGGGGPVGLARSNDLTTWTKYASNPVIADTYRWPSCLLVDGVVNMVATNFGGGSHLVLLTSEDGLSFSAIKTVVSAEAGMTIDNPFLFLNPNDSRYYLYYTKIDVSSHHTIMVKSAATIAGLDAATATIVHEMDSIFAAPSMLYFDGSYFLTVETNPSGAVWCTNVYTSTSPTGGFGEVWDSPVLSNGDACVFQHVFGGALWLFYAHYEGATWTLRQLTAPLVQKTR